MEIKLDRHEWQKVLDDIRTEKLITKTDQANEIGITYVTFLRFMNDKSVTIKTLRAIKEYIERNI